jgi:dipeptidyl aminopeptidase
MRSSAYTQLAQDSGEDTSVPEPGPQPYYGEGPFDPPSSDDEAQILLEKEDAEGRETPSRPRLSPLRILLILIASLVVLSALIGIYAAWAYQGTGRSRARHRAHITMDHVFNGTFSAKQEQITWVPEGMCTFLSRRKRIDRSPVAGDGVFSIQQNGEVKLVDLKANSTRTLVSQRDVHGEHGREFFWSRWKLSPDMRYMLVKTDYRKVSMFPSLDSIALLMT